MSSFSNKPNLGLAGARIGPSNTATSYTGASLISPGGSEPMAGAASSLGGLIVTPPLSPDTTTRIIQPEFSNSQFFCPTDGNPAKAFFAMGGFGEYGTYHYAALGQRLRERNLATALVNLYGHTGTPDVARDFVEARVLSDAEANLDKLLAMIPKSTPVVLAGFSLGAVVALHLASIYGDRIERVLLEGLYLQNPSPQREMLHTGALFARNILPAKIWQALGSRMITYSSPKIDGECMTPEWIAMPESPNMPINAIATMRALSVSAVKLVQAGRIRVPLNIFHGAKDRTACVSSVQEFARQNGAEGLTIFERSAHSVSMGPESAEFVDHVSKLIAA